LLATSAEQALGIADQRLQLNLFPDKSLTAQRQTVVPAPDGNGYHWIGHLVGVSNSLVYLVVKDQMVVGEIRLPDRLGVDGLIPGRVYQVRPQDNGLHVVREIGPRINPDSGSDFRLPPSDLRTIDGATDGAAQPSEGNSATTVQTDNGSTIDVLVAYTPAARQYVGSAAAVAMEVELAVGLTNQAYANSGINQRLQLVGLVEVAYTETTNMNTDLDRLTNKRDGYMDAIHTKRDEVGADLVALLLQVDSDIAGVGWLLKPMDASFEAYAFSVADICCIANDLVFAHELGHNMGAAHDWYVDDAAGAFDYSHGYVGPACSFKTIMAYGSECPWFNPIPYFSNPDLLVEGAAIGVRPGTNLGCRIGNLNNPPCDADNRLTLNNSALTVANFRQHVNPPAPTATPTVTPVPPMATATSTATPTARATTTTQPAATVTATALLPTPTGEPRDTATATPTAIVNPTTTPDPASTPTPTATPLPTCT
ncbi:MAG: hypothetical protein KDE31_21755, partial [Caldilineaceae bacterium]|nr:hypothetical protein [Caldilineaceae bacterium]